MTRWSFWLAATVLLAGCRQTTIGQPLATLVLEGGRVHTMDASGTVAEAVAVEGDRILFVGSVEGARRYVGPSTEVVDLGGATAFPGFTDAHAHLVSFGQALGRVDLVGTRSYEQVCARVAVAVAGTDAGRFVLGRGWDQNDWEGRAFPTHEPLSAVSPDHPVVLTRIDGHAILANARAMEIAGIDGDTPDPPGGKIHRGPDGRPTGVFVDTAAALVEEHVPEPDRRELREAVERAVAACHRLGLVGVHDAGVDRATLETYRERIDADRFDFRVYAMISGTDPELASFLREGPVTSVGRHRLAVRSVKLYADGALGSRGAALLEPYADDPGNRGLVVTPPDRLLEITEACLAAGFQVCTHAIGDRANRIVLDTYERARAGGVAPDPRLRIEHAQVLAPSDVLRFAELGVIPSMQPTHCTSDMDWAGDRLGPDRIEGAYPWRSLLDAGSRIPCGSDFPVESADPLLGIYAAVTRQHPDGTPQGGFLPAQRMTREEAVRGFTIDAAWAAFEEDLRGSLEPGKYADVTVFDRDLLAVPAHEILETTVRMTVVAGRIVYRAEAGS